MSLSTKRTEYNWINTEPGVLVLSGTDFYIKYSYEPKRGPYGPDVHRCFRGAVLLDTSGSLDSAKSTCQHKYEDMKQLGLA